MKAGGAEHGLGRLIAVGEHVVVGRGELAAAHARGQPGARLDDQRVGRDVVGLGLQRGLQRQLPVSGALARRAVDQVEADVLEARRPRLARRGDRAARRVMAIERLQDVGRRALHAERDAA